MRHQRQRKSKALTAEARPVRSGLVPREHRINEGAEPSQAPPTVREVLSSPGNPLDETTRRLMEPRFGYDFGRVRVHTDARAAASARAVNALAYTVGRNVVFDTGKYAPGTALGNALLAHELSHTIQQGFRPGSSLGTLSLTRPEEAAEQEANQAAAGVWTGKLYNVSPDRLTRLAREPADYKSKFNELNGLAMKALLNRLDALEREQLDDLRKHSGEAAHLGTGQQRLEIAMSAVWYSKFQRAVLAENKAVLQAQMDEFVPWPDQRAEIMRVLNRSRAAVGGQAVPVDEGGAASSPGAEQFKTTSYTLSSAPVTVIKGEPEKGIAEIKEAPADYADKILQKAGLDPKAWFSSFTTINFLGFHVGEIHTELAAHLKAVEKKLAAAHGGDQQDPKLAGQNLGLNEAIGGARHAPTGTAFSMHLFGLAIDVNYTSNPWISESANPVFERAGLLVTGKKMQFKAGMSFAELKALDETLETYFSYLDKPDDLRAKLAPAAAGQANFWSGKSADDALKQITQDLDSVAAKWQRTQAKDIIKKGGFLNLSEDLVKGLELDWGASYGDIMHFDMRNKGSGRKIQSAIGQYKAEKEAEAKKK
jgi:hypothetical protein